MFCKVYTVFHFMLKHELKCKSEHFRQNFVRETRKKDGEHSMCTYMHTHIL